MSTPTPPNDPSAAGELLPGEAELAALYRQLPRREPGPALDAAVRRAAAQALGAHPGPLRVERRKSARESGDWVHPEPLSAIAARAIPSIESAARARRRPLPHWLVALGSAASLVLVAGLAWHMRSAPTATLPAETSSPQQPVAARVAGQAADRAAAAAPSARTPTREAAARRQSVAANKQAAAPAVAEFAAPPPAPKPAPAVAPMAKARLQPQMTAASPALSPSMEPMRLEASAPAAAAPPAPPQADIAAQSAAAGAASVATPAAELARIEQLFAQGDEREAQQRLLDFHRAHPQWPLPPELQAKLPKP